MRPLGPAGSTASHSLCAALCAPLLLGCQTLLGIEDTHKADLGIAGAGGDGGSVSATGGIETAGGRDDGRAESSEGTGGSSGSGSAGTGAEKNARAGGGSAGEVASDTGSHTDSTSHWAGSGGTVAGSGGVPASEAETGGSDVGSSGTSGASSTNVGSRLAGGSAGTAGATDAGGAAGSGGAFTAGTAATQASAGAGPAGGEGGAGGVEGASGFWAGGAAGAAGQAPDPAEQMTPENRVFRAYRPWPDSAMTVCHTIPDSSSLPVDELDERLTFVDRIHALWDVTWQREINVSWYGWQDCAEEDASIRLTVTADGPSHTDIGYPGWYQVREATLSVNASDAEVLYTFGRILGFGHEYDLDRVPGDCQRCLDNKDCSTGDRTTCLPSSYCGRLSDHESIMAPPDCGGIEPMRRLTPWDVVGARRAYGTKPTGSLVQVKGACAQVQPNGDVAWRVCRGYDTDTFAQRFASAPGESDLLATITLPEQRCLEATSDEPGTVSGVVQAAPCDAASPKQGFRFAAVRLRALGGLCVVVPRVEAGVPLESYRCGGRAPGLELWSVRKEQIRLKDSDLCATVEAGTDEDPFDSDIVLEGCGLFPEQQTFNLRAGRVRYGDLCFNVLGGLPYQGKRISLWSGCAEALENELFSFSGQATIGGDAQCLDIEYGTGLFWGAPCDASGTQPNQQWDFYF